MLTSLASYLDAEEINFGNDNTNDNINAIMKVIP